MKSAVVFASKHSTTADIARRIAQGLAGAKPEEREAAGSDTEPQAAETQAPEPQAAGHRDVMVFDLADGIPDLTPFDLVVLGTPIYAGQPLPAMKDLLRTDIPDSARLGLFVIGMVPDADGRERELANAYPEELRARATAAAFLGGRLHFSRMNRFERFVVTRMAKTSTDVDAIDEDALSRFVSELRG